MSCYVRPRVTGARVFFTVNLAHRGSSLLVDEIEHLREAVRVTRAERPFQMDAFVVLPDHIHAVWTMPRGDRNYGVRRGEIKARFFRSLSADRWLVVLPQTDLDFVKVLSLGRNPLATKLHLVEL